MSDGKHLSNLAGDTKQWPVYMTIGNLSLELRQMASTHCILMVTLLLIPNKTRTVPQMLLDEQRYTN
jgi:hypothetical protein